MARLRAYPAPLTPEDGTGDSAVLAATRALLAVTSREEAAQVLRTAVHDLGGAVVPARLAETTPGVVDVDVALGVGEPQLVVMDPLGLSGMRITHHLPGLVQDALVAAARCDAASREAARAHRDDLTGLALRRQIAERIDAARVGDTVCMLDLDGFKQLNDTQGHAAGDAALQRFGHLLRQMTRAGDLCGRYGGDEFLVLLVQMRVDLAGDRMQDVVQRWATEPGHGTSVSVGVAGVRTTGSAAFAAADRALYRAKHAGRNRVVVAPSDQEHADE